MFKRLLVISAAALIIGAATVTQINAAEAETAKLGDANGDGAVDIVDVTVIQMHAAGLITLTGPRLAASDVDGSGITDIIDATAIQRICAGLDQPDSRASMLADFDGSGAIDVVDATRLQVWLVS